MEEPAQPKFIPKATGTKAWKLRLHYLLRPFSRTGPAITASVILYVICYNVGVRLWKGEHHPGNRFMWRLQELNGTLDPVLVSKKKSVLDYHSSRFYDARNTPPDFSY